MEGSEFKRAAARYESAGIPVYLVPATHGYLNENNINRDGNPSTYRMGRNINGDGIYINADMSEGDVLLTAVHEIYHPSSLPGGNYNHGGTHWGIDKRAWEQLPANLQRDAVHMGGRLWRAYGGRHGGHPGPLPSEPTQPYPPPPFWE
jgi:hypothetical protein